MVSALLGGKPLGPAIYPACREDTGVTVNVLVPGGISNAPMISDVAGFDRAEMIQPEIMAPPSSGSFPMPPAR